MNNIFNVAVLGSTGYVGMELVKLLNNHPNININFLGSETVTNEYLTNIENTKVYDNLPKLEKNISFNPNKSDLSAVTTGKFSRSVAGSSRSKTGINCCL